MNGLRCVKAVATREMNPETGSPAVGAAGVGPESRGRPFGLRVPLRGCFWPAVLALVAGCSGGDREHTVRDARMKMGTRFEIQVVAAGDTGEREARAAIEAAYDEIDRVEALLSEWRDDSEISRFNRRAGTGPVPVGPDLLRVVESAAEISRRTAGAFDITFASCGGLWSFEAGARPPTDEAIADCLSRVDHREVDIDPVAASLSLPDPEMRIGVAGIAKGYGIDRAAELLETRGFTRYIVEGGGDIRISGRNVDRAWRVGIAAPRRRGGLHATLALERGAVVTSGDYERFFEHGGVRYHHILDPATGRPARRSVAVTVIAPTAMEADALATGLFVLGPERGLALVEAWPGVEALFFDPGLGTHASSGFPALDSTSGSH